MRLHDRGEILAIEPETYRRWVELIALHEATDPNAPEAAAKLVPGRKSVGDIAVIRLGGFITQKPNLFSILFGGTSAEGLAREVTAAMREPSIGAVVLDVDSPGGSVFGVPEAANAIRATRGAKPLVAVANPLMASAAYHLASQADEVVAAPSSFVGSIGVIAVHVDESGLIEQMGLKVTELTYGRRKGEESSLRPLSDEARAGIQGRIDYFGRLFEADVAKGRRTSVEAVRSRFGEGSMFVATSAKEAGLVDRLGTMDEVLSELARGKRPQSMRAYDPGALRAHAILNDVELEDEKGA